MSIDHWMRFGTFAQQRHFEYPAVGAYRGVVINANMAAHAPAGLAGFLLEKTARSTYIIDPLTHAFQHDPDAVRNSEGEPKSSVLTLAEAYGDPVSDMVGSRPVLPDHFSNMTVLEGFVARCLGFQYEQLTRAMRDSDAAKYLGEGEAEVRPYAVVAPYFYLTETTLGEWLAVNIASSRLAVDIGRRRESKVFASVVLSKGLLVDDVSRAAIAEAYAGVEVDGLLLWVDGLDELAASTAELRSLLALARSLRGGLGKEVINLHGGYFSVLAAGSLGGRAMSGVTHGPEFGEHRGVVPVGGGIPIARYYIPDLHARIRYRDAVRMFRASDWLDSASAFHENVCDCPECNATVSGDASGFAAFGEANVKNVRRRGGIVRIAFPTKEARDHCLRHYLQRKRREFDAVDGAEPEVLLADLDAGYGKYRAVAGLEGVAHLRLWRDVFRPAV